MNEATTAQMEKEIGAALRGGAFASAFANGAALAILTGERLRLVYATRATLEIFEVKSFSDLEGVLAGAESPGARRLRRLAALPGHSTQTRLEHLRFFVRGAPFVVSLMTGRIVGPAGESWLVISSPGPAANGEPPWSAPSAYTAETSVPTRASGQPAFAAAPPDAPVRFLWAVDAEGRITALVGEVVARFGPMAPSIGERLSAFEARVGLDSQWSEAVETRKTFSGLRLEWVEPSGTRSRVVKLSGTPIRDGGNGFSGYRGFGVFTGEGDQRPEAAFESSPPPGGVAPVETKLASPPDAAASGQSSLRPGAEIFVLRPGAVSTAPLSNIVPIRPALPNPLASTPEAGGGGPQASVELTAQEREAFREIARALGARSRPDYSSEAELPSENETVTQTRETSEHGDFASLVDALPIGALVLHDGEVLFANRALLDFAGYESLDAFRSSEGLKTMFRGRAPETLLASGEDAPVVAAGGELTTVHAIVSDLTWAGAPATLLSLRRSRDLEHQELALSLETEARNHAVQARSYLAALDVVFDGFVRLDLNGRILMMSPRAEALFAYRQQEAAGANFLTLLSPQSQGPALSAFLRAVGAEYEVGGKVLAEGQARAASGRVFACRLTFARSAGSDPVEAYVWVEDREGASAEEREQESRRTETLRANERKTEFLALVSHEIRTPLQAILGFTEVMLEERFGPIGNDRYKDYLKDIHASGKHVISLANDLIDLAKIEAGKMELVFGPVDANQIIRDCVALMQPQAARERIIMRMSLSDKLPNVMADARSLRQIMLNLMSNAVKFNEPGGQVIVSTAVDEAGSAVIRVRDTGVGMSESELALALEPFRRAEGGKVAEGSGLGLPLTKALVEANHADFSIKSRKEQGTLVEVAFSSVRAAQ
jgi:signal transduction histidine kinase